MLDAGYLILDVINHPHSFVKTGIQSFKMVTPELDSRLRGYDDILRHHRCSPVKNHYLLSSIQYPASTLYKLGAENANRSHDHA